MRVPASKLFESSPAIRSCPELLQSILILDWCILLRYIVRNK
jgi:hypothetical protein